MVLRTKVFVVQCCTTSPTANMELVRNVAGVFSQKAIDGEEEDPIECAV